MEISVFSISKSNNFADEISQYIKMSSKFAQIEHKNIFSHKISKSQASSRNLAQKIYGAVFSPLLGEFNVILDERGECLDSVAFAKMLNVARISFFIGGAFGFDDEFRNKADKIISLSKLTTSHDIARLMLFEQIYRALCINAKHPYHK